ALLGQVTVRPVSTLPAASLSVAVNCCVPPTARLALAGVSVTLATGATTLVVVVPFTTFESGPKTALTLRVPRNATSSKPKAVPRASPSTVQLRFAPIAEPVNTNLQVPRPTSVADERWDLAFRPGPS